MSMPRQSCTTQLWLVITTEPRALFWWPFCFCAACCSTHACWEWASGGALFIISSALASACMLRSSSFVGPEGHDLHMPPAPAHRRFVPPSLQRSPPASVASCNPFGPSVFTTTFLDVWAFECLLRCCAEFAWDALVLVGVIHLCPTPLPPHLAHRPCPAGCAAEAGGAPARAARPCQGAGQRGGPLQALARGAGLAAPPRLAAALRLHGRSASDRRPGKGVRGEERGGRLKG